VQVSYLRRTEAASSSKHESVGHEKLFAPSNRRPSGQVLLIESSTE
jgi:hypothetical protein